MSATILGNMLTLQRTMTAGNVFVKAETRYNNIDQIGKNI